MVKENLIWGSVLPKFHQGKFHPTNPEKYMGDVKNIVYRSSWELHFLKWCDRNSSVLSYASEEFSIPYVSPLDKKVHRYYPDGLVKMRHADGSVKRYIVEIKPKKQTLPPKPGNRRTKSALYEAMEYERNMAKWKAAESFAKDNNIEFKIITEDELGIKQYERTRGLPKKRQQKNRRTNR